MPRDGRELTREREYVAALYTRLDKLRDVTVRRLAETRRRGASGTHQERGERDAFATQYEDRLAQLNAVETGLCFGRLDQQDGDHYYIGRLGLADEQHERLLIDWRAPAAQPFYRATAAAPLGVRRRRHLRLRGRTVVGLDDDVFDLDALAEADRSTLTGEAALLASLNASRTGHMSDIVATIQAEQDRIIRGDLAGVLVVQGGPGTGKTAVALHRAAYLLYTHRDRLSSSGVLVVGPNPVFLRYIEQVLPSLGETSVLLATPAQLVPEVSVTGMDVDEVSVLKGDLRMAAVVGLAVMDRKRVPRTPVVIPYEQHELILTRAQCLAARATAIRTRLPHNQARPVFIRAILNILVSQLTEQPDAPAAEETRWVRRELLRTEELQESLTAMWPPLTAARTVEELYASPAALAAAAPTLTEPERALLTRAPGSPWTLADLPLLDEAAELLGEPPDTLRRAAERRRRDEERRYAEGVLAINDLGDLVDADTLAERFLDSGARRTVADRAAADRSWAFGHVIVDEAQELSPMMWRLLVRRCPSRSMTVVGDLAQTSAADGAASWSAALEPFAAGRWRMEQLTVNYRTPAEIMALAAEVLAAASPTLTPPTSVRAAGAEPYAVRLDWRTDPAKLAAVVTREADAVGDGTVAVLVPRSGRAELVALVRTVLPGVSTGAAGALDAQIALLDVEEAKGLEFDAVVVVDPQSILDGSPRGANDLYVALTRATQRLVVVVDGPLPALLARLPVRVPDQRDT